MTAIAHRFAKKEYKRLFPSVLFKNEYNGDKEIFSSILQKKREKANVSSLYWKRTIFPHIEIAKHMVKLSEQPTEGCKTV